MTTLDARDYNPGMDPSDRITAIRARYVFPVLSPPIEGGVITFRGRQIIAVEKSSDIAADDLGNVAVVPGFVNAHTHLEFSDLRRPLGEPGEPLPAWIRRVISYRRDHSRIAASALHAGVAESLRSGVTAMGEIDAGAWRQSQQVPLPTMTLFREVIKPDSMRPDTLMAYIASIGQKLVQRTADGGVAGLSPHAPYSVHPQLLGPLVELAQRNHYPVAMHLAESPEEIALLRTGRGPLRDLLMELGVWRNDANLVGVRPLHYMQLLCNAPRGMVVHGNFLDDEEIEFAAGNRDRLAITYCPRTHAFFQHPPYPLQRLWSSGATICIGTDSRASNPDLNMLEELKFAAAHHPSVPPREILRFGTLNGAGMLSGNDDFGALAPGRRADLAVIQLPSRDAADPHELLFCDETRVVQTWYGGRHKKGDSHQIQGDYDE